MHDFLFKAAAKLSFKRIYLVLFSSIAFYPSIISLAMLLLAFFLLDLDAQGVSYSIFNHIQYVITANPDTTRTLLGTLTSGILSLMVFSFTMVMVVLTMASNNYTPRVLPELINNRSHQVILGIYLGTIGYLLIILINVGSDNYDFVVPKLSVFVSIILVFICFSAFIFFIHSISQNIQIANILANLYNQTRSSLSKAGKLQYVQELPDYSSWQTISNLNGAYFQGINEDDLLEIAQKEGFKVIILPEVGEFIVQGAPLLKISKPVVAAVQQKLQRMASYYHQEHIENNYLFGFKHITEVAVKAMSPGINDPGTAINAIDYLRQLLCDLMKIGNNRVLNDKNGYGWIFYNQSAFKKVFYLCFSSIRNYASADVAVQLKLLQLLRELEACDEGLKYLDLFGQEREALLNNANEDLNNDRDRAILAKRWKLHF